MIASCEPARLGVFALTEMLVAVGTVDREAVSEVPVSNSGKDRKAICSTRTVLYKSNSIVGMRLYSSLYLTVFR